MTNLFYDILTKQTIEYEKGQHRELNNRYYCTCN